MSKKHITIKELNNEGIYDTLYPNTSATQVPLSNATSQLFGQSGLNTDTALYKIIEKLRTDKKITVKVTDSNGNPVQGAKINGLLNSPTTSANGIVTGVFVSDPLTIVSPYVDLANGTANGADYVGTINVLEVVLQASADNAIFRYTSSAKVKFSPAISTIDVCCVGGGGGGGGCDTSWSYSQVAGGGGGGGIVNKFNIAVSANTDYSMIIGTGGNAGSATVYDWDDPKIKGSNGGSTSFSNLAIASGGGGGSYLGGTPSYAGGVAGATGCGNGGNGADIRTQECSGSGSAGQSNTTVSEFDDGKTFYSGGGGSGGAAGGNPNGAKGANCTAVGGVAGIGGGGGGAYKYVEYPKEDQPYMREKAGSKGGSGLVAIRIHLK